MKLSISVMAHPSREKYFQYLKDNLGDVPFSIDGGWGVWENCKRAWRMHDPKADYHVVIQDDAIICKDFKARAERLVGHQRKQYAYNFYFGNRQAFRELAKQGMKKGYIITRWTNWGVAICLPVWLIEEMIQFCDKLKSRHDDTRIGTFLKHKGIELFFPMPSLVNHRTHESSLVGDPAMHRQAWHFIDDYENK